MKGNVASAAMKTSHFKSLALISVCLASALASAQHVRFIVTGDDRWSTNAPRPGIDENGVNVAGMGRLVKAFLAEKPDVLLFNGDMVGGGKTNEEESSQFETWLKVMKPIYDAKIKVLAARGNHEMHCPDAKSVWLKAFSGPYTNPMDGPVGEEGMTYAYPFKNCLFISLDQFQERGLGVNQNWLDKTLKASHPPHIFAFAHKMAFFSGSHDDGMWTVPAKRDALITSLKDAGAKTVFFGHDHLYDHVAVSERSWAQNQTMHQFVVGTAGAPFVHQTRTVTDSPNWTIQRKSHVEDKLGYCIVDVDGKKVTILFKAETAPGVFEVKDRFEYAIN